MTAVIVSAEGRAPVLLSPIGARRLTDEIRAHLGSALVKLAQAREGGADAVLGYATWHAYVEAEFGDLRELRLPLEERRALVASMTDAGLSVREIVGKIGFSNGTVHADQVATGRTETVPQLRAVPLPAPTGKVYEQAYEWLRRQADRGLTLVELAAETGWTEGKASGALSYLQARGLAQRTETRRLNQRAFVALDRC